MDFPDPVFAFLRAEGCSRAVTDAGLPGLVSAWEGVVDRVGAGYQGGLDDYLNDMDTRDLLDGAWEVARSDQQDEVRERLAAADRRMRELVVPAGRCLYGDLVAEDEGWTEEAHWWYFSHPARGGRALREELGGGAGPTAGR